MASRQANRAELHIETDKHRVRALLTRCKFEIQKKSVVEFEFQTDGCYSNTPHSGHGRSQIL